MPDVTSQLRDAALPILAGVLCASAATAEAACAAHSVVVKRLAENYGEIRQSIALGADNAVVEVFASHETGTWTITVTHPGGPTCLVASGVAYEALDETLPVTDSPA